MPHESACARVRADWRSFMACSDLTTPQSVAMRPYTPPARENSSHCIANLIAHWWFGSQRHATASAMSVKGEEILVLAQEEVARKKSSVYVPDLFLLERLHFFHQSARQCPRSLCCFGHHLAQQLDSGVSLMSENALKKMEQYWIAASETLELTRGLTAAPLYFTRVLRSVLPLFGRDLRAQLKAHATRHEPDRLRSWVEDARAAGPAQRARHGVVHYRVGDMLSLEGNDGMIISPSSVARAAASLSPPPATLEILDGGVSWLSQLGRDQDTRSVVSSSLEVLLNLSLALREALPGTRLVPSTLRSADEDLIALANADAVVLAGGSFGIVGAAAGPPGQQVRSPACDHHLDVVGSRRAAASIKRLRDGWEEYVYELERPARRSERACAVWRVDDAELAAAHPDAERLRYVLAAVGTDPEPEAGASTALLPDAGNAIDARLPWIKDATAGQKEWQRWHSRRISQSRSRLLET